MRAGNNTQAGTNDSRAGLNGAQLHKGPLSKSADGVPWPLPCAIGCGMLAEIEIQTAEDSRI